MIKINFVPNVFLSAQIFFINALQSNSILIEFKCFNSDVISSYKINMDLAGMRYILKSSITE